MSALAKLGRIVCVSAAGARPNHPDAVVRQRQGRSGCGLRRPVDPIRPSNGITAAHTGHVRDLGALVTNRRPNRLRGARRVDNTRFDHRQRWHRLSTAHRTRSRPTAAGVGPHGNRIMYRDGAGHLAILDLDDLEQHTLDVVGTPTDWGRPTAICSSDLPSGNSVVPPSPVPVSLDWRGLTPGTRLAATPDQTRTTVGGEFAVTHCRAMVHAAHRSSTQSKRSWRTRLAARAAIASWAWVPVHLESGSRSRWWIMRPS